MKNLVITLVAALTAVALSAKNHMDPMAEMNQIVNLSNVRVLQNDNDTLVYASVDMLNQTNCSLAASLTANSYNYIVAVTNQVSNWNDLVSLYNNIVKSYTKKYGKPNKSYNIYTSNLYSGYGMEMVGLKTGDVIYCAIWEKEDYTINIQITKNGSVGIRYDK